MSIPNLPTDNLYKFLALFGIFTTFFFFTYPRIENEKIEKDLERLITSHGELKIKEQSILSEAKDFRKNVKELQKEINKKYGAVDTVSNEPYNIDVYKEKLRSKQEREYREFIYKYNEEIFPEVKILEDLRYANERLKTLNRQLNLKRYYLERNLEIIGEKNLKLSRLSLYLVIGLGCGLLLTYSGFRLWYKRVQVPLDEKLRKEIGQLHKNDK